MTSLHRVHSGLVVDKKRILCTTNSASWLKFLKEKFAGDMIKEFNYKRPDRSRA